MMEAVPRIVVITEAGSRYQQRSQSQGQGQKSDHG
jgi:hypothetical protein